MMQVAVAAFKLKDFSLSEFKTPIILQRNSQSQYEFEYDPSISMQIWFILRNGMNNILSAMIGSTDGILSHTRILAS